MYDVLKEEFIELVEKEVHGEYKQKCYFHSIQVSQLARLYALERGVNTDLAAIAGLYHDIGFYITRNSRNHGTLSADYLSKLLIKYNMPEAHRNMVLNAIRVHSDKASFHDALSEVLKDADVNAKYLEDMNAKYSLNEEKRIRY